MLKNRNFYVIVIIVVVLLSCLIAVQLYWIRNAYRLQQKNFNERVVSALNGAAEDIEHLNTSFYLYARSYIQPGQGITILKPAKKGFKTTDTVKLFNIFPYDNRPDTCFYSTNVSYYDEPTVVDISLRFEYMAMDSLADYSMQNVKLNNLDMKNFRQNLNEQQPITKRLKMDALDSVIKSHLRLSNINTVCSYGLRKKGDRKFEFISADTSLFNKKNIPAFSVLLLKNIAYTNPYELVVYINNSEALISKSLGVALLASFSIIMLLAGAFTYFVRTLLRQKKLSEMKTDFINNMTHEFMTPVTNIGLAIETLQKGNKTSGSETKILEVIAAENVHLQDNINKVLQVAVLERGSFLLNTTSVNIHEILERVARNFNIQLEAKEGKFVFNMNASNPVIDADETHIINLFYNIVDNAVKYTTGKPPLITISTGMTNKKLWASISDNGPGMSAEIQKHIFDKFYRGSKGDTHDVKGFGLGLSYVKSIADAHGFIIEVKSIQYTGTTFTIWFS